MALFLRTVFVCLCAFVMIRFVVHLLLSVPRIERKITALESFGVPHPTNRDCHDKKILVPFPPLEPKRIFDQYKREHSAQMLRERGLDGRKFIVSKFACPRQAGVHAVDYTTALLLAVATNRTLLHQYDGLGNWIQIGANSPDICSRLLVQADWIPNFDEFFPLLPPGTGIHAMHDTYNVAKDDKVVREAIRKKDRLHENIDNELVIEPCRLWGIGSASSAPFYHSLLDLRDTTASTYVSQMFGADKPFNEQTQIHAMYAEGVAFLYGMLFSESFALTEELLDSVRGDIIPTSRNEVFSIGMHSRHSDEGTNGSDTWAELFCLDQLVQLHSNGFPCHLYLMSDREETIRTVREYAAARYNCNVATVAHYDEADLGEESNSGKIIAEHGFAAGAGYFQDLALLAGGARSAFSSKRRSSSALVIEMMEYNRRMEAWQQRGATNTPAIPFCRIRKRKLSSSELRAENSSLPDGIGPWAVTNEVENQRV